LARKLGNVGAGGNKEEYGGRGRRNKKAPVKGLLLKVFDII
jgi:hypothetical protein